VNSGCPPLFADPPTILSGKQAWSSVPSAAEVGPDADSNPPGINGLAENATRLVSNAAMRFHAKGLLGIVFAG
jgi:hypothetical protein